MLTIRAADVSDSAAWLTLWNQYLAFYQQVISPEVTAQTWHRFFVEGGHRCLLAIDTESDSPIGFATYLIHPSTWTLNGYCYLEDLFVDPSARGQGAGRQLIDAVVAIATESRIQRIYWHTHSDNVAARGLYDKVATKSEMIQYRKEILPVSLRPHMQEQ